MVDRIQTNAMPHGNGGLRITIPSKLHHDSRNPIKPGDPIEISVDGKRMIITPLKGADKSVVGRKDSAPGTPAGRCGSNP